MVEIKIVWKGKVPVIIRDVNLEIDMKIDKNEPFEVDDEKGEKLLKIKGFEKV